MCRLTHHKHQEERQERFISLTQESSALRVLRGRPPAPLATSLFFLLFCDQRARGRTMSPFFLCWPGAGRGPRFTLSLLPSCRPDPAARGFVSLLPRGRPGGRRPAATAVAWPAWTCSPAEPKPAASAAAAWPAWIRSPVLSYFNATALAAFRTSSPSWLAMSSRAASSSSLQNKWRQTDTDNLTSGAGRLKPVWAVGAAAVFSCGTPSRSQRSRRSTRGAGAPGGRGSSSGSGPAVATWHDANFRIGSLARSDGPVQQVFLCLAVVAGGPGGYHGGGVIDPANTDAGAGQDEQDPCEAHPDTLLIQNPAALLDYLFLPCSRMAGLLLHGGIGLAVGASTVACAPPHQRAFPSVAAEASAPVD